MRIGLVGLGRMGSSMARRLLDAGHEVVGFDLASDSVRSLQAAGGTGAATLDELVQELGAPRAVWVMVPHGPPTTSTLERLRALLDPGDILVDGGNSHYLETLENAKAARSDGIRFLDIGVSGGVWGVEVGYNMMAGGPADAYEDLKPILDALAPENGVARVGDSGAGHFVKMIHNAIEYAMLQGIGEGFECMERSEFDLDLGQIAHLWQNGAVVRCWLLELLGRAFDEEGNALAAIGDRVDDSGTGRWTVEFALRNEIAVPIISQALYERFDSRLETRFAHQVVAALRNQFGGHAVERESGS